MVRLADIRMMKRLFILSAVLVASTSCFAVKIGSFPGLAELIDKADAIVILRVDQHVGLTGSPTLYTTHECLIYQSLKGDIPTNTWVMLQLMDTRTSFVSPFVPYSTHLMFLTKKRAQNEPTDYRTIEYQGANVRLSPFGHEKPPEGETVQQRIQFVVRNAIAYWSDQQKKGNEFLEKMLKP
jgi:hypothetical protein